MIDPNAIRGIAGEQYDRWKEARHTFDVPYLHKRGEDRELQKARAYAKGVSVKKQPSTGGGAAPAAKSPSPWMSGPNVIGQVAKPGTSVPGAGSPSTNGHTVTPNAGGFAQAAHGAAFGGKGYNQPNLTRNAPGAFGRKSQWSGHATIQTSQPPAPPHTIGNDGSPFVHVQPSTPAATPPRPTIREAIQSGIADIQARRIEQDTRMAQQRRSSSFGNGATSHSTGHGSRAF
ncbi:hypothetical protein GCM10010149_88640 [Nonomuraea roseoviolacea subsp. roseoviolacea]|uniref:hypothetical protein n=1 Tax=Nonomuraea roseoviolacea TaxID=103837 RepID=UPI0031E2D192